MNQGTEYLIFINSRTEKIYGQERDIENYRQIMTGTDREFFDSLIEKKNLPAGFYLPFCLLSFVTLSHTVSRAAEMVVRENPHLFEEKLTGFAFEAVGFLYFSLASKDKKGKHEVQTFNFGRTTLEMGSGLSILVPEI